MLASGKRPCVTERVKRQRLMDGVEHSRTLSKVLNDEQFALESSGRVFDDGDDSIESDLERVDPRQWAPLDVVDGVRSRQAAASPAMQIAPVVAALKKAAATGRSVPLFYERPRAGSDVRADSVVRASLRGWLESPEGQAWSAEKRHRQETAREEEAQ